MFCGKCGTEIRQENQFCTKCGAAVPPTTQTAQRPPAREDPPIIRRDEPRPALNLRSPWIKLAVVLVSLVLVGKCVVSVGDAAYDHQRAKGRPSWSR